MFDGHAQVTAIIMGGLIIITAIVAYQDIIVRCLYKICQ